MCSWHEAFLFITSPVWTLRKPYKLLLANPPLLTSTQLFPYAETLDDVPQQAPLGGPL